MKINGPGGIGAATPSPSTPRASGSGFRVSTQGAGQAAPAARTAAPAGVVSVDALLALQETEGPLERKRRAVRRAGRLLDVLDEVKMAMLEGRDGASALQRLSKAVREARDGTDDDRLEGVLNEVETRAAVELAKAEMSRLAA